MDGTNSPEPYTALAASLTADLKDASNLKIEAGALELEFRNETDYKGSIILFLQWCRNIYRSNRFRYTSTWVEEAEQCDCEVYKEFTLSVETLLQTLKKIILEFSKLDESNSYVEIASVFENMQQELNMAFDSLSHSLELMIDLYCE